MGLEEDSGSFLTSLVQVSIATLTFLMARPQARAWLIGPGKPSAAERSKRVSHWGIFKAAFHFLMGKEAISTHWSSFFMPGVSRAFSNPRTQVVSLPW